MHPRKLDDRSWLHPAGLVAYAHLLLCSWMIWIGNPCRRSLGSPSIFTKMSLWFGNILWAEWKWMCELDHWLSIFIYPSFMHIQWGILWHDEVTAEHREFHENTVGWYSLAMNHARALLQGRRRLLEGRKKIIIHQTSPNQTNQRKAVGLDFLMNYGDLRLFPESGHASDKCVVSSLHHPFNSYVFIAIFVMGVGLFTWLLCSLYSSNSKQMLIF